MTSRMLYAGIALSVLAQPIAAQRPIPPAPVLSPQVLPDRRVTFRVAAPGATSVVVVCECLTLEQIATLKQEQSAKAARLSATDPEMERIRQAIQALRANQGERALTKDATGVWSVTLGPLEPDLY
jgi:hypothetical protein